MRNYDKKISLLAMDIISELFRKEVWMDANVVNEISYCCFSKIPKVRLRALKFFLGIEQFDDDDEAGDSDDETEKDKIKQVLLAHRVGKKTNNRAKKKEKLIRAIRKRNVASNPFEYDTYKLRLLRDPQGFCEKLYHNLDSCTDGYHVKMMLQDLISRLIGVNSLILLNFYPNIQRYLTPRQPEVTKILLFAAQSTHKLVPPDVMNEMTRCIAVNFINESNTPESITVGLNALREICKRCPFALADHIIEDLGTYRSFKDKNVSAAARSLINILREANPALLPRKLRSKPTEDQQALQKEGVHFANERVFDIVPGAEVLIKRRKTMTDESLHNKTVKLMTSKLLTDDQLHAIKSEQLRRAVNLIGHKEQNSSDSEEEELPTLEDIEQYRLTAREKMNKEKETNKEDTCGLKNKPKFGKKRKSRGGLSNKDKRKSKLFSMMKHKYKTKGKRSLKEKQSRFQRIHFQHAIEKLCQKSVYIFSIGYSLLKTRRYNAFKNFDHPFSQL
ncbi:hypothetical protein GJ496_000225 [Pomphorhynchus laevis]|nr:hypothetical protein GJ496_000225 [Pomphorhynchus laevis]